MMPCEPPEATDGRATSAATNANRGAGLTQSVLFRTTTSADSGIRRLWLTSRFILPPIPLVFSATV